MTSSSTSSSQSDASSSAAFSSYPLEVVAASSSEEYSSFPFPFPFPLPTKPKQVRFALSCSLILVRDRTFGIEDKFWYSSEDIDCFKAETDFIVREVRRKLSLIDSLEGYSCCDELYGLMNRISCECQVRRELLISRVLEEQMWQRIQSRVGASSSSSSSYANHYCDAEIERQRLASISEEHSRWARQRARDVALLLQKEVSDHMVGKAWRHAASQVCTDQERARKVRRCA